jgi:hypothetical protein
MGPLQQRRGSLEIFVAIEQDPAKRVHHGRLCRRQLERPLAMRKGTRVTRMMIEPSEGADPNRRIGQKESYSCSTFKRIGRTDLMYAAENAGEELMSLLIDAGADTAVQDTLVEPSGTAGQPGDGIADYLARNEGLSESEKESIVARWRLK